MPYIVPDLFDTAPAERPPFCVYFYFIQLVDEHVLATSMLTKRATLSSCRYRRLRLNRGHTPRLIISVSTDRALNHADSSAAAVCCWCSVSLLHDSETVTAARVLELFCISYGSRQPRIPPKISIVPVSFKSMSCPLMKSTREYIINEVAHSAPHVFHRKAS